MTNQVKTRKPYVSRKRGLLDSDAGKPCPTCYALMERVGSAWTCTKHGAPSKP